MSNPADGTLEATAADIEDAIGRTFNTIPAVAPTGLKVGGSDVRGGWFDGTLGDRSLKTGYYVAKRGDWLIKIRATMPSPPSHELLARTAASISTVDMGSLPGGR